MYLNILRTFLIMVSSSTVFILVLGGLLPRRKPLWIISSYLLFNIVVVKIGLGIVLREYHEQFYQSHAGWQFAYVFGTWFMAILSFIVVKWTYDASIQKVMIVSMVADLAGSCFVCVGVFVADILAASFAICFELAVVLIVSGYLLHEQQCQLQVEKKVCLELSAVKNQLMNFKTKKKNHQEHGYGMKIVEETVKKYHGSWDLEVCKKEKRVVQQITFLQE